MDALFQNKDLIILIMVVVVSLLIILYQLFLLFKISQSKNWKEADGEIISSDLVVTSKGDNNTVFRARITYHYIVENNKYVSRRIYYGDRLSSSFKNIYNKQLKKYPIGQKIKVFYNPLNNNESVVERRVTTEVVYMLIVNLVAFFVGLYFLDISSLRQLLQII